MVRTSHVSRQSLSYARGLVWCAKRQGLRANKSCARAMHSAPCISTVGRQIGRRRRSGQGFLGALVSEVAVRLDGRSS
eukprot:8674895-Lingulodinium_polyedra.AAC.1